MNEAPPEWQPNGAAAGESLGRAVNVGSKVFAGAMAGLAAQRHYQATGDWRTAAVAGGRGLVRWYIYFWVVFYSLFYLGACALTLPLLNMNMHTPERQAAATGVHFQPGISTREEMWATIPVLLGGPILTLFSVPYGLGVLWVRNADRSLFRVNHRPLYRALAPFAYRMRRYPDIVLMLLPIILWGAGMFGGTAVSYVISAVT